MKAKVDYSPHYKGWLYLKWEDGKFSCCRVGNGSLGKTPLWPEDLSWALFCKDEKTREMAEIYLRLLDGSSD